MLVLVHGNFQLIQIYRSVMIGVNGLEMPNDIGGYFLFNQVGADVGEQGQLEFISVLWSIWDTSYLMILLVTSFKILG